MGLTQNMNRRRATSASAFLSLAIVTGACATDSDIADGEEPPPELTQGGPADIDLDTVPRGQEIDFGPAPATPDGAYAPEVAAAVDVLFSQTLQFFGGEESSALQTLGASGDVRVGWLLSDLMRVSQDPTLNQQVAAASSELLQKDIPAFTGWNELTSTLIAWDIPAPPDYLAAKRVVYAAVDPRWVPLFDDNSTVDWRFVSWGGVLIDDRAYDTTDELCNCIPAADNPTVQTAEEATWLEDDTVIFGVVINGEARAYPRRIMEVREMVNDTLGGRDFAMPYCTLCGAAQVWFTDDLPEDIERPIFRTSGLLIRSNKVMYDLTSGSIFDTFRGEAETGDLLDRGIQLNGHTVVTSTWGAWVEENPDTTVLIEDLALGRDFDFRGEDGRDNAGPIFPIGDVDPRLPVQEDIVGILQADGTPLAIHVASAVNALNAGQTIELDDGVQVVSGGDGIRVIDAAGEEVTAHQAFWFAWSQFHEGTELWPG